MKLDALNKDFSTAHLDVIDLVDEETPDLEKEHEVMDKYKEDVTSASLQLRALLKAAPSSSDVTQPISHKLSRIKRCPEDTEEGLSSLDGSHVEASLLEQHKEKVSEMKKELYSLYDEIIALDLSDNHEVHVVVNHASMEALQFNCACHIKKLLNTHSLTPGTLPLMVRVSPSFPS